MTIRYLARSLLSATRALSGECVAERVSRIATGARGGERAAAGPDHGMSPDPLLAVPLLPGLPPGPLNLSAIMPWPNLGIQRASTRFRHALVLTRSSSGRLRLDPTEAGIDPGEVSESTVLKGSMKLRVAARPRVQDEVDRSLCRGLRGFVFDETWARRSVQQE